MALHERRHPEPVAGCFGCKVIGITYGVVPGAYRDTNSSSMYDREAILSQLGDADGNPVFSRERIEDKRSDMRKHYHEFQEASDV